MTSDTSDRFHQLRLIEALLFASAEPLGAEQIRRHVPDGVDVDALLQELVGLYANRGVTLVRIGQRWAFRTAADVAPMMQIQTTAVRKPSRAAIETLAIVAYHQPVTRAEIEEIRGVALSRGTLDTLLEAGWIKPRGRRRTPGRPVTWGTTEAFLDHFGLESLDSLPGIAELKAAGLIDTRPAITALSARGHLLAPGEPGDDTRDLDADEDTDDEDGDDEAPLEAGFGEDLLSEASIDDEPAPALDETDDDLGDEEDVDAEPDAEHAGVGGER